MTRDIVREMGLLMLGTRFRRLGERLQADTQQIIDDAGAQVLTTQYPLLAALDGSEGMTVGELSRTVGASQPGVTRALSQLAEAGLIDITPSRDDQRRRNVKLSKKGETLVAFSRSDVWPRVAAAVANLCEGFDEALLEQIALMEDRLEQTSLIRRAPGGMNRDD